MTETTTVGLTGAERAHLVGLIAALDAMAGHARPYRHQPGQRLELTGAAADAAEWLVRNARVAADSVRHLAAMDGQHL